MSFEEGHRLPNVISLFTWIAKHPRGAHADTSSVRVLDKHRRTLESCARFQTKRQPGQTGFVRSDQFIPAETILAARLHVDRVDPPSARGPGTGR